MRLTELNPNWCGHGGHGSFRRTPDGDVPIPERKRVGLMYDCPCGCGDRRYVPFENPEDGGPAVGNDKERKHTWHREGTDFETLTLTPSIQHVAVEEGDCSWHGFITAGEVRTV